jgi:hypothetical protein
MCVVIYWYIHEWEIDKNTKFYVVHIRYKSNTYGGAMLQEKNVTN